MSDHTRYWGSVPRPKSKAEFFNAVTAPAPEGEGTVATIRIYGPIDSWGGWWGVSAKEVGQVLDSLPGTVESIVLRINSPGGEVFEGVSILNMLRSHRARVTAVVDGYACSAASVIAAGVDETVMSPATQMMIHSPWTVRVGNAAELRKAASMLDGVEASIVEIYTAKAGEKDWAALLADETWLTGPQAVELGLADRVAVVKDAGDAATVGEEPVIITVDPDGDDVEDSADSRLIAARVAASIKLPADTEPGISNREEGVVIYDDLQNERLGATDVEASATVPAVAAEAAPATVAEAAAVVNTIPEGAVVMDAAQYEQLLNDATAGREAREEQIAARRDGIVAAAVTDGRIAPATRDKWRASLDKDEAGIADLLASFAPNTIPVAEIGHSDTVNSSEDALYNAAFGTDTKEA